jgi:hypothetical protein
MVWQTMNERIRLLLSQAGIHYEVLPKDTVYEKFAELIVRECLDIAKRTRDNFGSANPDVLEGGRGGAFCVYHNIKNTFGVEE